MFVLQTFPATSQAAKACRCQQAFAKWPCMSSTRPFKRQRFAYSDPCKRSVHVSAEESPSSTSQVREEEDTDLQLAQQSFHSIFLEGCEALVASTPDGRLDLREMYVRDEETDIFAQPEVLGELPSQPHQYTELEWASEDTGDTLMGREGSRQVLKVYLIQVEQQEPFRLNLREVYSIDHATRVLTQETIYGLTEETDPALITLSITRDGIFLEENKDLVSEYDTVEAWWMEQEQERVAKKIQAKSAELQNVEPQTGGGEDQDVPRDPIDALNDDDREYDESQEDTPSVDQGY